MPGIADQVSYDALARQVVAGHGFTMPADWWPLTRAGEPTAHWSFLYSLYLAGIYAIFGSHPLAARLVQALAAGVLCPLLVWRVARRLFGAAVALAAAASAAVYGYFVYYAGALMTETFFLLAVLWALDVATGLARAPTGGTSDGASTRPRLAGWLPLGLALGIAVLLRQAMLVFVPFLFAWLFLATRRSAVSGTRAPRTARVFVLGSLVALSVLALSIAPWTLRNYQAFGRIVLLNTNAGYAFFWANHPIYGTEFVPILPADTYHSLVPPELRSLDEAALDSALLERGLEFVRDDPARYVALSLSRARAFFEFWPSSESSSLSNVGRVLSYGLFLPLMLYGLVLAWLRRRSAISSGEGPAVLLLVLFAVVYSLVHLLSWALIRYRLPVDAALMPFAGLALADLITSARAKLMLVLGRALTSPAPGPIRAPDPLLGNLAETRS